MHRRLLLALVFVAGCGGSSAEPPRSTPVPTQAAATPEVPGEIVVSGEASPASHGPYAFEGEYTVRFEQTAPEDPSLDFTGQTAFVADLNREAEIPAEDSIKLFAVAKASDERTLKLDGRFYVDVSFGDFPYAIRFTPHEAAS
ncbi:hypothetical protein OJ997_33755 [Solirubrobacter phytolaccae]|uniref:Lipoprotein n=1 Tax=Solirubrobacter phytolaccae TaxID=1404360 RepID=A0A9X3NEN0_9ACTN|nr:hypothetical protein [Solirubrobacter phytolaccae]MDA0185320.1 hypothetical protein [Solirubrobacter phytolaccae]